METEPIRAETITSFINTFVPSGFQLNTFRPSYGMAETTLLLTGVTWAKSPIIKAYDAKALEENQVINCSPETENSRKIVSCGHPSFDQTVTIVNPVSLTRCASGEVGEIWVTGGSVAQGYWRQPEQTKAAFSAYLADTKQANFANWGFRILGR